MAYKETERTLAADLPEEICVRFEQQRKERGQVKKASILAAIKLWLDLPLDLQGRLLDESMSGDAFLQTVEEIVLDCVKKGYAAGQKLAEIRQQQPDKRD